MSFGKDESAACRATLEAAEEKYRSGGLSRPVTDYVRSHADVVMPFAAMLARGKDDSGKFIHFPAPREAFSAESLALYEEVRESQSRTLSAGKQKNKSLLA